jgi:EAL domain-containing protein (putative c-di-GMP-specific phosphodiesterase class I)
MSIALSNLGGISTSVGVTTCFHPIYSVRERTIIGLEALSRGYAGISSEEIPPQKLFRQAEEAGRLVELDRHCQETAAASFVTLPESAQESLLFLNVSAGLIEQGIGDVHILSDSLLKAGLSPDQIVLEIVESKVVDINALSFFVQYHRRKGFLIALDDVGAGHSNLERISLLKPDIIKIDRALISGISSGYHKQEVCKALILLSHRIGALTVAEGIEDEEEALTCLALGADMLQGFYFNRPLKPADFPGISDRTILDLAGVYAERSVKRKELENTLAQNHRGLAERLTERLARRVPGEFPSVLLSSLRSTRFARCAYIVDEDGRQLTATLSRKGTPGKKHRLFAPAPAGTDHSLKSYVLRRGALESCYITEPYISKATGNLCITASRGFRAADDRAYILCIDIDAESVPS